MTDAVSWIPEYSVGVAELDLQHQRLFRIAQELSHAIGMGQGSERLAAILGKVIRYTIEHFATEEELMLRHGFPGAYTHRDEHNRFTMKISQLQQAHLAGKAEAAEDLLLMMQQWLQEHVTKRDREYVSFLRGRGVR